LGTWANDGGGTPSGINVQIIKDSDSSTVGSAVGATIAGNNWSASVAGIPADGTTKYRAFAEYANSAGATGRRYTFGNAFKIGLSVGLDSQSELDRLTPTNTAGFNFAWGGSGDAAVMGVQPALGLGAAAYEAPPLGQPQLRQLNATSAPGAGSGGSFLNTSAVNTIFTNIVGNGQHTWARTLAELSGCPTMIVSFANSGHSRDAFAFSGIIVPTANQTALTNSATFNGGPNVPGGTVFRVTPSGMLTTLYDFCSQTICADGGNPVAAPVQGPRPPGAPHRNTACGRRPNRRPQPAKPH